MRRTLPYLNWLWTTDIVLTTLLVSLLTYIFSLYPVGLVGSFRPLPTVFFSPVLSSGTISASRNRISRILVLSWGLLTFILIWIRHLFPTQTLTFLTTCLSLLFLVLLAFLILGQTFREGATTSRRIMGAVASYLILGVAWSLAYFLIALRIPGAFSIQGPFSPGNGEALRSDLFYFSFVTLTTLGYGDIVPVHPMVRMLVILEGVVGQLFPVILIARLVSLQVQSMGKT